MKLIGKFLGMFTLIAAITMQVMATDYTVDRLESSVQWKGKKVTGEHYGTVEIKSGNLEVEDNKLKSGIILMDMTTINNEDLTNESMNQKLVGHLKAEDFFYVNEFPESRLELKEAVLKSGNNYTFTGDLTIKDITHPVTFDGTVDVKNGRLNAKGEVEVDRTLYDIKFRSGKFFSDLGDKLIYDTFTLNFDVVAKAGDESMTESN